MLFTDRDDDAAELPASMLRFGEPEPVPCVQACSPFVFAWSGGRSLKLLCAHPRVYAMEDFLTDKEVATCV